MKYCSLIANHIHDAVSNIEEYDGFFVRKVTKPFNDLNEDGSLRSTKKTIYVTDYLSTKYKITVEAD